MEDFNSNMPQETAENSEPKALWLTDRLLAQLRRSSWIGIPLMVLCALLGSSAALSTIFYLWFSAQWREGSFYLLEGDNLSQVVNLLGISAMLYTFTRGVIEGLKAWQLLRSSETNDDALLEGTERLGKMFRWLTIWGGVYVVSVLGPKIWHAFLA